MNPNIAQTVCQVGIAIFSILAILCGLGSHYYGKQIPDYGKQTPVTIDISEELTKLKIIPPDVKVTSITPVMIYKKRIWPFSSDKKITIMDKGISLVLHLESGSKPVVVSRLKVIGKVFVSSNFYLAGQDCVGRTLDDLGKEWEDRRPYVKIDWTAVVDEKKSSSTLNAFDDQFICFNLMEPIVDGQSEDGWEMPISDYFGHLDGSKEPTKTRTYPKFDFFFKRVDHQDFPSGIRDEIKNGDIKFILMAGSKEIVIPYESFNSSKLYPEKYWDKNPIEKLMSFDK